MFDKTLVLGVAPVKRSFLSMEEAKRQKDKFMRVIRSIHPELVRIVDMDDLCENGIAGSVDVVPAAVKKFGDAGIQALFLPFCDFGEETVAVGIAAGVRVPTLVWGARDERPNYEESRGRDTQCGMFAATKVLRRHGVKYSYIYNVATESDEFRNGFENFVRVACVLRDLKSLRIAKIGERPGTFMSVMTNDANLVTNFGITTVPLSPAAITARAMKLIDEKDSSVDAEIQSLTARMDMTKSGGDDLTKSAATVAALKQMLEESHCSAAAFECWSAFNALLGVCPCVAVGEMTDLGYPMSCECDVNGAITMAILRACKLYEESCFLADLTIRHPTNDNAELLWHCGPFPYSLKDPASPAAMVRGQERFELKQGDLTLCRFDDIDGGYSLFCGEGKSTTGPETAGTYVWLEVDNWKRWEEKLMFGPYIHHVGGVYGHYLPVLREVARYLGIAFDNAHEQGIHSL